MTLASSSVTLQPPFYMPQRLHDVWELIVNCCESLQSILSSLPLCKIMVLYNSNFNAVNKDPKLRLQNGIGTEFSCLKCGVNLISRKIVHYLCEDLARTIKNESKMQENPKLRTLKSGFYCTHIYLMSRHFK